MSVEIGCCKWSRTGTVLQLPMLDECQNGDFKLSWIGHQCPSGTIAAMRFLHHPCSGTCQPLSELGIQFQNWAFSSRTGAKVTKIWHLVLEIGAPFSLTIKITNDGHCVALNIFNNTWLNKKVMVLKSIDYTWLFEYFTDFIITTFVNLQKKINVFRITRNSLCICFHAEVSLVSSVAVRENLHIIHLMNTFPSKFNTSIMAINQNQPWASSIWHLLWYLHLWWVHFFAHKNDCHNISLSFSLLNFMFGLPHIGSLTIWLDPSIMFTFFNLSCITIVIQSSNGHHAVWSQILW